MISLRQVAQECLGLSRPISVDRDVYGYRYRDDDGRLFGALASSDTLPGSGQATARSLLTHLRRIQGMSINLSVFLVGDDGDFANVTRAQVTKIQYAIQVARDIYSQADLGIRKIYWIRISVADAGGYVDIADKAEAECLTDDFSGPNDGIDAFWVQTIGDAVGGWCNTEGPCDKDSKDSLTGVVITLARSARFSGVLLAHELGHYLGLGTGTSSTNLMGVDIDNDGVDELNSNSTSITSGQASTMRRHCFVRAAC